MNETVSLINKFGERAVEGFENENVEALTPARVENYHTMLSAYSSQLESRLGELEMREAIEWVNLRTTTKTNEEAKRIWKATPEGQEQIKLKSTLKGVDKIISACKRRMDRMKMEAYNMH